jgi:hypothetical protein
MHIKSYTQRQVPFGDDVSNVVSSATEAISTAIPQHAIATKTTKKCVSFAPTIKVRPIVSLSAYTEYEKTTVWYSVEESEKIQVSASKLIMFMESGQASQRNKKYCTRGLEGYTQNGYKKKMMNRFATVTLVLDEQDRQKNEYGAVDYDLIASAYHQAASGCQRWAYLVGFRDWKVASACYSEDISHQLDALRALNTSARIESDEDGIELETPELPENHSKNNMGMKKTEEQLHEFNAKSRISLGAVGVNSEQSIERNSVAKAA